MRTLIVGLGALGGVIGARLLNAGATVFLATRDEAVAHRLRTTGLHVSGVGGDVAVPRITAVAPIDACTRALRSISSSSPRKRKTPSTSRPALPTC